MAVAFDNAADLGNNGGSTSSLTHAYTVSGSNPFILVGIVGDTFGGNDDITGVTYAGSALSFIGKEVSGTTPPDRFVYLYGGAASSTGSNNVVVSASHSHYLIVGAASYNGVSGTRDNQSASISAAASNNFPSNITPVGSNCWSVVFHGGYDNGNLPTAGTGSFPSPNGRARDAAFGTWGFFDSNGTVSGGSAYTMVTEYGTALNPIVHLMVTLAPVTASPTWGWGYADQMPQDRIEIVSY